MRNDPYSTKQQKPIGSLREAFLSAPPLPERLQKINRVVDSISKGVLWLGYGVALVSWFVAANAIIAFSMLLKGK
ncbi:hypothetical protein [Marinobacter sp. S6332]|uniref:hypothetical protein n=1 Tax=Marinobacter sp. S6332 TaxID=2926403 RepID=UPI001FF6DF2E|nr:hypothetical protein [Marinobacter sp. S6332]MCK0163797.1 hypothetical protein [Marinobacter sp. S6332]